MMIKYCVVETVTCCWFW